MTETDWLACQTQPRRLFHHIEYKTSPRKLHLISAAVCRLLNTPLQTDSNLDPLQALELYADGQLTDAQFVTIRSQMLYMQNDLLDQTEPQDDYIEATISAVAAALNPDVRKGCSRAIWFIQDVVRRKAKNGQKKIESQLLAKQLCAVIHEIVGNPYRKWTLMPPWQHGALIQPDGRTVMLNDTIRGLADTIHVLQAFDRLPILADALEESGITDEALLAHCRSDHPHLRGCWALDVIRGKM